MAVTEYTWNPLTDSVIEETDGAGNVLVEYTNEPAPYGPLISEHRGSESRQYHFDALGSTRALTDDSQTGTDTFRYDAWGVKLANSSLTTTSRQWNGQWGYQTGISHTAVSTRARIYNADKASWETIDPTWPDRSDSAYHYSANRPVWTNDPSGLDFIAVAGSRAVNSVIPAWHYSLQRWECCCSLSDLLYNPDGYTKAEITHSCFLYCGVPAKEVDGLEMAVFTDLKAWGYRRGLYPSDWGKWELRDVWVGWLRRGVTQGNQVQPIFDSSARQVAERWDLATRAAMLYTFMEPARPAPYPHWPQSYYDPFGSNSNTFIRWVVPKAGMSMVEMSQQWYWGNMTPAQNSDYPYVYYPIEPPFSPIAPRPQPNWTPP